MKYLIVLIDLQKPEVFISYQWGSQKEILSLRKWLKKFGMTCWLDVEQISIGDVLFEKIYDGIKHCKLFLSCVTTKYMESDNCRFVYFEGGYGICSSENKKYEFRKTSELYSIYAVH